MNFKTMTEQELLSYYRQSRDHTALEELLSRPASEKHQQTLSSVTQILRQGETAGGFKSE